MNNIITSIYLLNIEEYEERTRFERSQAEWNETWFSNDITHELLSVTIWKDFSPMS
ncbi:hypothetical protein [Gottfriedia acidiceleris]|uniref:hypothetical protein n=1 Tax=Gottfriedia acidiceleris TaxID=371036 RepID=UPI0013EBB2ED|nr:hypothetical protein [Gottfriedia acidiceleris]